MSSSSHPSGCGALHSIDLHRHAFTADLEFVQVDIAVDPLDGTTLVSQVSIQQRPSSSPRAFHPYLSLFLAERDSGRGYPLSHCSPGMHLLFHGRIADLISEFVIGCRAATVPFP